MIMLPVTYGYARVSKSDDDAKNLETQLRLLANHGIREDLIFTGVASGRTMNRPGWRDLMGRVQPGDTIVVAFLDRFSRNFEEGVRIQAELTARDIGVVDAISAGQRGCDQRHHLVAGVRPPRRAAEVEVTVDEFPQAQVPGEGGRQEQAGIGHQAVIVEGDTDAVGVVAW